MPFDIRQENIKNRINKVRAITAVLNGVLWNRQTIRKKKLQIYNSIIKSTVTYEIETRKFNKKFRFKTYVNGNELFEEIGEIFQIIKNQK